MAQETAVAASGKPVAARAGRKAGKLPYRQNATRDGRLLRGANARYRDLTPGEWYPCPACRVPHGGYCYAFDGATVADWQ